MFRLGIAAFMGLALASCAATIDATPDATPLPSDCNGAFAAAAASPSRPEILEALNHAVRTCGSIEEWEAAYNRRRGAFIFTADARTVLSNMCLYSSAVNGTPLCHDALAVP